MFVNLGWVHTCSCWMFKIWLKVETDLVGLAKNRMVKCGAWRMLMDSFFFRGTRLTQGTPHCDH